MSSRASSEKAGPLSSVTKHHVCCTNGVGEPRIVVGDVEPGSIVRFGIDDDMTCIVIANFESEFNTGESKKPARTLVMFGCFCDEETDGFGRPTGNRPYEEGKLMSHMFGVLDTVSIVLEPGMYTSV